MLRLQVPESTVDASAVLAAILGQPGAERVTELIGRAVISSVNLAEVVTKLEDYNVPAVEIRRLIAELKLEVVSFGERQAYHVASLRRSTRRLGLSLGDRACIALA